jgi:plasmid stabilization system protein ParE
MRPFHITPSAEQDVIDITSYTLEKWGEKQALNYAGLLEKRFHEIGRMTAIVV